jgi:putative phosphoesterase
VTTIGLVSDIHLPRFGRALPRVLEDGLRSARVSRIMHMGDFTDPLAIELFEAIAPLEAVAGNNDPPEIAARFGRRRIVEIDGVRIGLVHGDSGPGFNAHENALAAFAGELVGVVLYGHSHKPFTQRRGAQIVVNPGSPTDKRTNPQYSYGILTIADGQPSVELHYYSSNKTR